MVIEYSIDSNKSIYGTEKSLTNNKFYLKWKSTGISMFLIFFGSNAQAVNINTPAIQERITAILPSYFDKLMQDKNVTIKEEDLQVFLVTHDDLKRDGGMQIKEKPGVYAVYGIDINESDLKIYLSETGDNSLNSFTMVLDVIIEDRPYYTEKGLFKKKQVYSGYHAVRLGKQYPSMVGGVLKYRVDNFVYSFPDDIVKNGGVFYVNAAENINLEFLTNNPGIQIK